MLSSSVDCGRLLSSDAAAFSMAALLTRVDVSNRLTMVSPRRRSFVRVVRELDSVGEFMLSSIEGGGRKEGRVWWSAEINDAWAPVRAS